MSIWTHSDSDRRETLHSRPTVNQLLAAVAVLLGAAIAALIAGPGFGVLVVTLALLACALWIAYGASPSAPAEGDVMVSTLAPGHKRAELVVAPSRSRSKPQMPILSLDRATVTSLSFLSTVGSVLAIVLTGAFVLLRDRANVPPGFFADEAEIGVQALKLLHWNAATTKIPFFYHHLEYEHLGTLSLVATAPFVGLFGLTENAVRGASAFWTIAAAIAIYFTLRRLRVPYAVVPVVVTIMSPLVILVARTNFGHAPSLLAMATGFLMWVVSRQQERRLLALGSGLAIGLAAYGQSSYYIAVPLFLLAIGLTEVVYNRLDWKAYVTLVWMGLGAVLILLPVPYRALTYDPFLDRYRDKTAGAVHGIDRLTNMVKMYPDYFSYDMLFVRGTTGWQTRHTVVGAPWFFATIAIMLAVGLISLVTVRGDTSKRYFWPMALVLLLYPIPDILSRPVADNPYSFSLVWGSIAIPFVAGYGFIGVRSLLERLSIKIPRVALLYAGAMLLATSASFVSFWRGPFQNYQNVAADYWGWQYGARSIAEAFESHAGEYDQFMFSPDFNAAYVLNDFYTQDSDLAGISQIGGLDRLDLTKRQLFAIRESSFDNTKGSQFPARSYLRIVDVINYPNGTPAFYLVAVDPSLLQTQSTPDETTTPAG